VNERARRCICSGSWLCRAAHLRLSSRHCQGRAGVSAWRMGRCRGLGEEAGTSSAAAFALRGYGGPGRILRRHSGVTYASIVTPSCRHNLRHIRLRLWLRRDTSNAPFPRACRPTQATTRCHPSLRPSQGLDTDVDAMGKREANHSKMAGFRAVGPEPPSPGSGAPRAQPYRWAARWDFQNGRAGRPGRPSHILVVTLACNPIS